MPAGLHAQEAANAGRRIGCESPVAGSSPPAQPVAHEERLAKPRRHGLDERRIAANAGRTTSTANRQVAGSNPSPNGSANADRTHGERSREREAALSTSATGTRNVRSNRRRSKSAANAGGTTWELRVAGSNPAGLRPVAQRVEHEHVSPDTSSPRTGADCEGGGNAGRDYIFAKVMSRPIPRPAASARIGECRPDYMVRAPARAGGRRFKSAPGQPGSSGRMSRQHSSPVPAGRACRAARAV